MRYFHDSLKNTVQHFDSGASKVLSGLARAFSLIVMLLATNASAEPRSLTNHFDDVVFEIPAGLDSIPQDYRKSWTRLTGFEPSGLHWNQYIVIYAGSGADVYASNFNTFIEALESEDFEDENPEYARYPAGAVVLKENYSSNNRWPDVPTTLTAMIKREVGFDPEGGDWEYIELDVNGRTILRGKAKDPVVQARCAECHANIADRDYIFSNMMSKRFE